MQFMWASVVAYRTFRIKQETNSPTKALAAQTSGRERNLHLEVDSVQQEEHGVRSDFPYAEKLRDFAPCLTGDPVVDGLFGILPGEGRGGGTVVTAHCPAEAVDTGELVSC